MPTELEDFPPIPKPPHQIRNSKYPWDSLFNGSVWKLVEGEDFPHKLRVFRQQATLHARRHGYALEMKSDLVDKILYLRATKLETPHVAKKSAPRKVVEKPKEAPSPKPAPPPQPIDPVAVVFGDSHDHLGTMKPPPPKPIRGFQFGDVKGKEDF